MYNTQTGCLINKHNILNNTLYGFQKIYLVMMLHWMLLFRFINQLMRVINVRLFVRFGNDFDTIYHALILRKL